MQIGKGSIDFDLWRAEYDDLTFADQCAFYDCVAEKFPEQAEYNGGAVWHFLKRTADRLGALDVMEIGGWDGQLGEFMLGRFNGRELARWTNYDISAVALERGSDQDYRYEPVLLENFPWKTSFPYRHNVFVATHFIEHIRAENLMALFSVLTSNVKFVGLQAPIPASAKNRDWTGYTGSHILEVGWAEVSRILAVFGFELRSGLCDMQGHGDFVAWERD